MQFLAQCSAFQHNVLLHKQYNALHSVLQHSVLLLKENRALHCAVPCNAVDYCINSTVSNTVECSAMRCNTLQCSAIPCSAVQHNTMQYNTQIWVSNSVFAVPPCGPHTFPYSCQSSALLQKYPGFWLLKKFDKT